LVCGRPQESAIIRTAELNEKEGNFDFMTISVLASLGTARSTAIELK
jgi:hypothetical protein